MGMRLLRGRGFAAADRLSEQALTQVAEERKDRPRGVVIVNDAMARKSWPDRDPIGQAIVLADHWAVGASTVVGVVSDVRGTSVDTPAAPTVFAPSGEISGFRLSVALRSRASLDSLIPVVRETLRGIDPQMLVANVRPMQDVVSGAVSRPRFYLAVAAAFALLALALATIGIYGVIAYLAARRTREIGIRMALGARAGDVLALVLKQGLTPVAAGVASGTAAAAIVSRTLAALLFGVGPLDPWSFAAAAATLAAAAFAAVILPAARAARIDPLSALRHD